MVNARKTTGQAAALMSLGLAIGVAACSVSVPTGPAMEQPPCDENARIWARTTADGQLVALVSAGEAPQSALVVGEPGSLTAVAVTSVDMFADGGSMDVVAADETKVHFDGGFTDPEKAETGKPTGKIEKGLGSLDLFTTDDAPIKTYLAKACE